MSYRKFVEMRDLMAKRQMWMSKADISPIYAPHSEEGRLEIGKKLAKENGLPMPTENFAEGSSAVLYNTDDPSIVLRISADDKWNKCEKIIDLPQMQKTGGVNVILKQILDNGLIFSWKEKVDTNWHDKLYHKYRHDREKRHALDMVRKFHEFVLEDQSKYKKLLQKLLEMPETRGFVKAIIQGIPIKDLHTGNFGLSLPGSKYPDSLQVIDC